MVLLRVRLPEHGRAQESSRPDRGLRPRLPAWRRLTGPVLVIKTLNAGPRPGDAERLRLVAARRPDVILIDDYLESDELTALMARCTAYVSLHRAEGLGLTIAEAMAWGRPVVVSAYSGNMQFTNSRNAFLVPCTMTAIPPDADPYPAGTPWAIPIWIMRQPYFVESSTIRRPRPPWERRPRKTSASCTRRPRRRRA